MNTCRVNRMRQMLKFASSIRIRHTGSSEQDKKRAMRHLRVCNTLTHQYMSSIGICVRGINKTRYLEILSEAVKAADIIIERIDREKRSAHKRKVASQILLKAIKRSTR
jgi:hypothetical protein